MSHFDTGGQMPDGCSTKNKWMSFTEACHGVPLGNGEAFASHSTTQKEGLK